MSKHEAMDILTVADLLSVSDRQVRTWMKQGLPHSKDGRSPVFNWPEARDWWATYKYGGAAVAPDPDVHADDADTTPGKRENLDQANERKARAQADIMELNRARMLGEVIDIASARERVGRMLGNLRAKMLGLPPKLANRLQGVKDRPAMESVITEEMTSLCAELSTGEIVGGPPEPAGDAQPDTLDTLSAAADDAPDLGDLSAPWLDA